MKGPADFNADTAAGVRDWEAWAEGQIREWEAERAALAAEPRALGQFSDLADIERGDKLTALAANIETLEKARQMLKEKIQTRWKSRK